MAKVKYYNFQDEPALACIHCPGCGYDHCLAIRHYREGGNPVWEFNKDMDKPTFSPSLLVFGSGGGIRCHSFIKDGFIQFLSDCDHKLANQTVELPEVNDECCTGGTS